MQETIKNDISKKNIKIIDAVKCNGKYIDATTMRQRLILGSIAVLAVVSSAIGAIILF